jgi:hypothetical protein
MAKELLETQVKIGPVRFAYVSVFKAKAFEDDEDSKAKYSVQILLPKSDKTNVKAVKRAIAAAVEQGKGKWGGKIPIASKLKMPLRDGDEEFPDSEDYAGMYFFNATSQRKPTVVRKVGDDFETVTEEDDLFFSGVYGRVFLNFFPYSGKSKGVAAGLNHIQYTKTGERLSGGISAEEAFDDDWEDDEDEDSLL